MSPHFRFQLDEARYFRASELFRAANMEFVEERQDSFRVFDWSPLVQDICGRLCTSRGEFPACLRSSGGAFEFCVTVTHDAEVLEEVERALTAEPGATAGCAGGRRLQG